MKGFEILSPNCNEAREQHEAQGREWGRSLGECHGYSQPNFVWMYADGLHCSIRFGAWSSTS